MISNELLTEVLKSEFWYWDKAKTRTIDKMYLLDDVSNLWMIEFTDGDWSCVSIYELAHRCKEWLKSLDLGYEITSIADHTWFALTDKTGKVYNHKSTISELEHVIAACEWALHNYKKESTSD